jgi:bacterial/archaeal transporter family-2 protein
VGVRAAERTRGSSPLALVALTVVAGGGLAVQARVNGELAVRLGSPLAAGALNMVVGLAVVALAAVVGRRPLGNLLHPAPSRWWHWTGGLCAVVFVYAVVAATPRLGVTLVSVSIAAGMAAAGLFADAVGLGLAGRHPAATTRVAGALVAVGAVAVSSVGAPPGSVSLPHVALALAGGFGVGCQQPVNSRLSSIVGDATVAAVVSFAVGATVIVTLATAAGPVDPWPAEPLLYVGGVLAAGYVLVAIPAVSRLGALRLALATLAGQLIVSAVLDVVAPIGDQRLTAGKLAGVVLAIGAVAVSSRSEAGAQQGA